uniref:Uncharacterized protein n=1 Tax=Homalodisca liturata TaxID=320908 RepID=A0A1B6HJD1_9HEMI
MVRDNEWRRLRSKNIVNEKKRMKKRRRLAPGEAEKADPNPSGKRTFRQFFDGIASAVDPNCASGPGRYSYCSPNRRNVRHLQGGNIGTQESFWSPRTILKGASQRRNWEDTFSMKDSEMLP